MFLGDALISWKCKKQNYVLKSSTESQYRVMSAACVEVIWLHGLLTELGFHQVQPIPLHVDNTSVILIAANPIYHECTKHIEIDSHFIRQKYDYQVTAFHTSPPLWRSHISSPNLWQDNDIIFLLSS